MSCTITLLHNFIVQDSCLLLYIIGANTARKVDALVQSMGMTGIFLSKVSSICRGGNNRLRG